MLNPLAKQMFRLSIAGTLVGAAWNETTIASTGTAFDQYRKLKAAMDVRLRRGASDEQVRILALYCIPHLNASFENRAQIVPLAKDESSKVRACVQAPH